jgi:hypothetical protein
LQAQSVKWHLLAHRRRVERHRAMAPAGIAPPTKWSGALEEAYEAAVAAQGGLQAARPKSLFAALQADFPELTQQIVKCHLQKQRKRAAAAAAAEAGAGEAGGEQQQQAAAAAASGTAAAGSPGQPGDSASGGSQHSGACGSKRTLTQQQQQQQQQQHHQQDPLQQQRPGATRAGSTTLPEQPPAGGPQAGWQHLVPRSWQPWQPFLLPAQVQAAKSVKKQAGQIREVGRCRESIEARSAAWTAAAGLPTGSCQAGGCMRQRAGPASGSCIY